MLVSPWVDSYLPYSSVCYEECLQCESASKVFQLGGLICDCKSSISTKVCFQLYCQRVLHLSEDRLGIRLRWWYHNFLLCLEIICNNTMSHPPHSTLYILHWMLYQLLSICPTTPHLSQFCVLIQHHDNDAFVVFICVSFPSKNPPELNFVWISEEEGHLMLVTEDIPQCHSGGQWPLPSYWSKFYGDKIPLQL